MKKWTFGGLTLIVIGFAALTMRMGCQVDLRIEEQVTPIEHRFGWDEEAAQSEATRRLVESMPDFEITGVKRDNRRANVRLWEHADEIGVEIPNYRQEIGDCVSFGAANAIDYLQCVQIALGHRSEFQSAFEPYLYGTSRVQIGGGRLGNSDGSVGAWAAKAVQQYGVLSVEADGVPSYAGRIAKQWGYRGPPDEFISVAKETLVKTVAPMRSADDVRDAICNGHAVTIASNAGFGSISERDGRQVGRWTTSWAHQMAIVGYDGSTADGPWYYVLNSWGPRAHPRPLQGEPAGGFWISERDVERIVSQGDSFAFSAFEGFPAQDLDFNVLRKHAQVQWIPVGKEKVMLVVLLFGVAVCFCLLNRRYRRGAVWFAALLLSCGVAHAIEFDVMSDSPTVQSFDVMADGRSTKGMDFAVLSGECRCAVTGECDCAEGECACEDCPRDEQAEDDRPVITVRTMPGCVPCKQCKAQSKKLSGDYRFVFVEQSQVKGGAPRVEWQGANAKWSYNGWKDAEFFERVYRRSQQAVKTSRRSVRRSYARSYRPVYSRGYSFGGCRTCRSTAGWGPSEGPRGRAGFCGRKICR